MAYSSDDAAAMNWLRANHQRGELLVNDQMADAGVWAPYKAGVPILAPRLMVGSEGGDRDLVRWNFWRLKEAPDARAATCALGAAYAYYGGDEPRRFPGVSPFLVRQFPPLETLRQSPDLEVVFESGGTVIFRIRNQCDSQEEGRSPGAAPAD